MSSRNSRSTRRGAASSDAPPESGGGSVAREGSSSPPLPPMPDVDQPVGQAQSDSIPSENVIPPSVPADPLTSDPIEYTEAQTGGGQGEPGSASKRPRRSEGGEPGSVSASARAPSRQSIASTAYSQVLNDPARRRRALGRADIDTRTSHHHTVRVDNPDAMEAQSEAATAGAPESEASSAATTGGGAAAVYIWGTRVSVASVQAAFRRLLTTFKVLQLDEDERVTAQDEGGSVAQIDQQMPYYMQRLQEISITEESVLNVNLGHVREFDEALYKKILCYPADIIPYLDLTVNEVFSQNFDTELTKMIEVRPFNAEKTRNMRGLNPEDIDQLITINGMVIRTSQLIPEMRQAYFECILCKNFAEVEVDRGRVEEPVTCTNCANNHCFQLIHNRCVFTDKQLVKLQEAPDDMPAGQTPHTVTLLAHGQLVDSVQPGDRVTVTGIYRAVTLRVNPRMRVVKSVYKTQVDVLHFRKTDTHRLHQSGDGHYLPAERIAQIKELSQKADICERLSHALAPSIYEQDDIKKGILCLLFGGTRKNLTAVGRGGGTARSEINVLLCGDPGTSKSQLLQYVHHLVPRSQYTSGKGSSAVGLTASVTKDPDTKHFVLQTGALVLSDNGVCCIDEFDKMSDSTRSVLHEVMEQQTLSITKAGIICQLNARTSILAAANPVDSEWNKEKTIVDNLQLPHTLLSRFDLIFLIVDPQDEMYDRRLAAHLVSLYYKGNEDKEQDIVDMSLMRDYVAYAKAHVEPSIGEQAGQALIDKYLQMRKTGSGRGVVSAYPRQLESLIRLSEACAKIRLSDAVELSDVEEAYRLHREALKQSATDPLTGRVDVNILAAGMSAASRKHCEQLADAIKTRLAARSVGTSFHFRQLLQDLRNNSDRTIGRELYEEALNELMKNDIISRTGDKIRLLHAIEASA